MHKKKQKNLIEEVFSKLVKYCNYQERSLFEIEHKMKAYGLSKSEKEKLLNLLVKKDFVNEERFAVSFVRGKVNAKRWGRYKIKEGLVMKGLASETINNALQTIDEVKYRQNLNYLIDKRIEVKQDFTNEIPKLFRFLQSKGYESELINEILKEENYVN